MRDLAFGQLAWPRWCPHGISVFPMKEYGDHGRWAAIGLSDCPAEISAGGCEVVEVTRTVGERFSHDCGARMTKDRVVATFAGTDLALSFEALGGPTDDGTGWLLISGVGCELPDTRGLLTRVGWPTAQRRKDMKTLPWLLAVLTLAVATGAKPASPSFPKDWLGHWRGPCTFEPPVRGRPAALDMELVIGPVESSDRISWRIVYHEPNGPTVRRYALVPVDPARGQYLLDENNGILIEAFLGGAVLRQSFEIGSSRIESREELHGDMLEVEMTSWHRKASRTSEGHGDTVVRSFAIQRVQRCELRRGQEGVGHWPLPDPAPEPDPRDQSLPPPRWPSAPRWPSGSGLGERQGSGAGRTEVPWSSLDHPTSVRPQARWRTEG